MSPFFESDYKQLKTEKDKFLKWIINLKRIFSCVIFDVKEIVEIFSHLLTFNL
jgi:hypothetical protein